MVVREMLLILYLLLKEVPAISVTIVWVSRSF